MEYVELKCASGHDDIDNDFLTAVLGELGFESFVDDNHDLLAYIPSNHFNAELLENESLDGFKSKYNFSWKIIPDQNWNHVWEENFTPVTIDNRCYIRAPFHPENKEVEYEIIIEPKMSFGTAHHETTAGMIKYLLDTELVGKRVLDMGSGTGILAILTAIKGAESVVAIDNDEWAYNNALENIIRNNTPDINVLLGDASLLKDQIFDIILANINRNILLNDMPVYSNCLIKNGLIFFSGFYTDDLQSIIDAARISGLEYRSHCDNNRWVAACFEKQ